MTKVKLRDWEKQTQSWECDTSSGDAIPAVRGVIHGFLYAMPDVSEELGDGMIFAAYADGGKLWFQEGARRWELESVVFRLSINKNGMSRFVASALGEVVVDVSYSGPLSDPFYRTDPTFDASDMELLDFFYYISMNSRRESWHISVLDGWSKGIS